MICLASPPLYWVGFHWGNVSLESFFSRIRLPTSILVTILLACTTDETKKKCTLSVNVSSAKVLMGDTIFTSPNADRTAILRNHLNPWRSSNLQGKDSTFNSQVFQGPTKWSRTWNRSPAPPHLCSQVFYQLTLSCRSQVCIWVNLENLVLGPHLPATLWAHTMTGLLKMPIFLFGLSAWKEIRKHTSGDSWVHWGLGLEQGSHCYYLSGT